MTTCKTCKHYRPIDDAHGFCKRFPPTFQAQGPMGTSRFPTVTAEDGCGEHAPDKPVVVPRASGVKAKDLK